jgi:hypothetical protein
MARRPIIILKAYLDGTLTAVADGEGTVDGTPVDFVKVSLNGATSRLAIDKASGRLLLLAFQGRDTTMRVGQSVRRFTQYSTVDGVTLPTAYAVTFDGKELPAAGARVDAFEINPGLPADLYRIGQE